MSMEATAQSTAQLSAFEQLRLAREIIDTERRALSSVSRRLDREFCRAIDLVYQCRGNVIVSGMGKAGLIGQKIMATLASTGTPAHCLHPAEAVHGDLGRIQPADVVLMLSQSGETEEVLRLLPSLAAAGVPLIALTGRAESTLARAATVVVDLGPMQEACGLGLAPSTSTTAMLAVGDALALVVSQMRGFRAEDFARYHPAGSLGRKLAKVEDEMRPLDHCRVSADTQTVRQVLVAVRVPGRRSGATMLVDPQGKLSGIFTDSDLARLFENHREHDLERPISEVMTRDPLRVKLGSRMRDAVSLMAQRKISELPVVDADGRAVGMIDVTDVMADMPVDADATAEANDSAPSGQRPAASGFRLYTEPQEKTGA